MKPTNLMKAGLLALALAGLARNSAHASVSAAYTNRDVLLGFYDPSLGNNYVLDLGPLSSFNFNTNFTLSNTVTHLANDLSLSTAFGTNWYSDATLYFGVTAGDSAPSGPTAHDVYATNPNGSDNPWPTSTNQGTEAQDVTLAIGPGISQKTQAAGQTSTGLLYAKSTTNSWDTFVDPNTDTNGSLDAFSGAAGDGGISATPGSTALGGTNGLEFEYLKQGVNTSAQSLGYWSINSSGDVSFTTAAVPEPSTFAAVGMGAAILAFIRRRRS